jgi:hypothetical protein
MSDDTDNKPKLVKIHLTECDRGGMHVTGIEPITDADILYDAPDSDEVLSSSTVGWSPAYARNWDANFSKKSEPEPELN